MKLVLVALFCILVATAIVEAKRHHHKKEKEHTFIADEFDPVAREFETFVANHKKVYSSPEEKARRLGIFRKNYENLPKWRKENPLATFGVTKFFDLTPEEFKNYGCGGPLIGRFTLPETRAEPMPTLSAAPPAAWDWSDHGAVTPVKNQQQCGSCWAFSTVGMLEGAWFLAGNSLTSLSEQEFVDCSKTSFGCGGGWPFWALTDILTLYKGSVDTEASYPYTAADGTCTAGSHTQGAVYTSYKIYCDEQTPKCNETAMVDLLYSTGPLSACLDAGPFQSYQSGILNPPSCDPSEIDHCITITGYGSASGQDYWRIKNSWGQDWGEQGYVRLARGNGVCGINVAVTMASIKSSSAHTLVARAVPH